MTKQNDILFRVAVVTLIIALFVHSNAFARCGDSFSLAWIVITLILLAAVLYVNTWGRDL
jgi:Zn-dependent protease with chaperone function